jgi:predicted acylesterase/phospholipase RssA
MLGKMAVVAATLMLIAMPTRAQEPAHGDGPSALSLTVSGGVSLGAYEAGFLAYAIGVVQRDAATDLRILTGASAGSLNSLLALLVACRADGSAVSSASMFWNSWISVGFDQLTAAPPTPLGAFSREWLARAAEPVEQAWNRGLDPACDVVLGVSTTRVEPRMLRAAGGRLELPRMEEKFAIRVQGRGAGRPPRATNYASPGSAVPNPLLVTDERGEIAFSEIRDLIFASMAFPVAFAPQPLRTCVAGGTAAPGVCLPPEAATAPYVDGGIFDNAPLRMAVGLARSGLHEVDTASGRLDWRDAPDPSVSTLPATIAFAFVNPNATEYPLTPRPDPQANDPSLTRELERIALALVETGRSKELAILLEEHPDVADRIVVPRRQFPAASAPMFAFLGFFEREFRVFDFHLGMYDAQRMLSAGIRTPGGTVLVDPSRAHEPPFPEAVSRSFACMRAVYDRAADADAACRGDDLSDFRALLQVSLDQLYDACRGHRAGVERSAWSNAHCDHASAGEAPPRVPGLAPARWPEWRRSTDEAELTYSMRLLAGYGFRFDDLGVPPGRGDLAVARIRAAIGRAADRLAAAQPSAERGPVTFAAKLAADSVAYSPPTWTLHLTMGPTESELGVSRGLADSTRVPRGLRVALAVGFRGLEGALTSGEAAPFATLLVGGLELQPTLNTAFGQARLGLRAGMLFANDDDLGAIACGNGADRNVAACTRPVVQGVVGFTILERFRIQLVGECFPGIGGRSPAWSVAPGIGLELGR